MSYPLSLPAAAPLITLTHPKPSLWVIELHNGQDNRLTADLVDHGLKPALDAVERHWREQWRAAQSAKDKSGGKGALIIVGRKNQDKFFSNGLDFANVVSNPNFFPMTFNPLLSRLLTFPIPTIAAINGHCYAGGFMLSLACDYRVMTDGSKRNAWLCMNEVHFGAVWPRSFAAIVRAKVGDHRLQRKIALEGHRFTAKEAYEDGLLDAIVQGQTAEILIKAEEIADKFSVNAQGGVWGLIKACLLFPGRPCTQVI
ncbi:putative secondary metabolism biosynthetic enzyme [Sphagnurus paluster]|uniref:Secondary metabolism biosynthetic enzyme n=1 Tax=Sphagnurus paluster TaxID=117069 RepID=A0A9P7FRQ4_9AGAR|nr:putative secondary metabolism biosynthetic enzyme [Sphagnurus paluster]